MEEETKRKEVIQMKMYQKQEVVFCGDALEAIQSMGKISIANDAQPPHEPPGTVPAYEADE
jgi:hypothetical protein